MGEDRSRTLRAWTANGLAVFLLLPALAGMIGIAVARDTRLNHADLSHAALLTLPATLASLAALVGLALEPGVWPPRRVLAVLLLATCLATQLGAAGFAAGQLGVASLAVGAVAALVYFAVVAVVDYRGGDRGQLVTAVVMWTVLTFVLGAVALFALHWETHPLTIQP